MFPTKPRPVPSRAALRVLYQLAYISSGTAVGVGVLCAEERRRRTQIVQRIADNAKRIRQHPRYVANAALAVREGAGAEEEVWDQGEEMRSDAGSRRRVRRRGVGGEDEAVKGQDLPSVVEEEYGAVVAGRRKRNGRRTISGSHTFSASQEVRIGDRDHAPQRHSGSRQAKQRAQHHAINGIAYHPVQPPGIDLHKQKIMRPGRHTAAPGSAPHTATSSQVTSPKQGKTVHATRALAHCQDLFGDGRIAEAIDLYVYNARQGVPGIQHPSFYRKLFHAGLNEKLFAQAAEMLRLQTQSSATFVSQCAILIKACILHDEHELLLNLFFRNTRPPLPLDLFMLPKNARASLAVACCTDETLFDRFEALYRSVGKGMQQVIDERRCHLLLRAKWQSTKSLNAVKAELHPLVEHLEKYDNHQALRLVDRTMTDIYISANRTSEALEAIARMHKARRSDDINCILLAAQAYAGRQAWGYFHQVLQMADLSSSTGPRQEDSKRLHQIVRTYSMNHSASQTWKFVTWLQEKFCYRPNMFARRTVLGSFVSRKAIALLPKWLQMLNVSGDKTILDGQTAAQLLNRYYEDHRPSHVLVMWFCRNLAHLVPSFDPKDFFALIQKSISYDLSGAFERSAVWQRDHAQQRLERLRHAEDQVPSPGYRYDRQLHFRHPNFEKTLPVDGTKKDSEPTDSSLDEPEHIDISDQSVEEGPTFEQQSVAGEGKPETAAPIETSVDDHGKDEGKPAVDGSTMEQRISAGDDSALEEMLTPKEQKKGRAPPGSIKDRMLAQLSLHRYKAVLEMYEGSLDALGLPTTVGTLSVAVRASLKLHGRDNHAQQMIAHAEKAGMNVVGAWVPVLIHQMRTFDLGDRDSADRLLGTVIRYYEVSNEHAFVPTHHVSVTAANLLITNGRPAHGVNLLRTIVDSQWAVKRSIDIVFLTVMIKGYVALDSIREVLYWAREALRMNIRIAPNFVRELKRGLKRMPSASRRERAHLLAILEMCKARRQEQAFEAKILGKELVATIARCMREETTVDIDARGGLDRELFGPTLPSWNHEAGAQAGAGTGEGSEDPRVERRAAKPSGLTRRERMLQNRWRVANVVRQDPAVDRKDVRQSRRLNDGRWLRQYRAFLRRPMVLEDGRHVPFRYCLPSESAKWRTAEKGRRAEVRKKRERFWDVGEGR